MKYFTAIENRSERSKQTDLLAPVLRNPDTRFSLLKNYVQNRSESDDAIIFHYVWVLRDQFYSDRNDCKDGRISEKELIDRWVEILNLNPEWASKHNVWKSKIGKSKKLGIVHPCQKSIGWTKPHLKSKNFNNDEIEQLENARMVMNTECDCFIQTPARLIIVECKDKTDPKKEQRSRHSKLINAIQRLLKRDNDPIYIELTNEKSNNGWTWHEIAALAKNAT